MTNSSEISGFYKLSPAERIEKIKELADLTEKEVTLLKKEGSFSIDQADNMIENVVGTFPLPLGIAVNFKVNDKEYLIPMAIEEPSVVAAASNAAKIARVKGGFKAESTDPVMIGELQLMGVENPGEAKNKILENRENIIEMGNEKDKTLVKFGGGMKDVEVELLESPRGPIVLTKIFVDCRDAMGANAVNTMVETLAPFIEEITGGKVYLRIISNLADRRLVKVSAVFDKETIGGEEAVDAILNCYALAQVDPYRASTHNKGVMNGISAVVRATGNDTRAVEAGVHAYAGRGEGYKPVTHYEKTPEGNLLGTIEIPMAVGTVGGATKVHPIAQLAVKILGVKSANELAEVIGAVGLAQNFAALKALATEGIQRGHMRLHARNVAVTAGAEGELIDKVVAQIVSEKNIRVEHAKEILEKLKN